MKIRELVFRFLALSIVSGALYVAIETESYIAIPVWTQVRDFGSVIALFAFALGGYSLLKRMPIINKIYSDPSKQNKDET